MKLQEVIITRQYEPNKQTKGSLSMKGFKCNTLELPYLDNQHRISCIPEGTYTVVKRLSDRFDEHFHILNVPNRDLILIHSGNFVDSANPDTQLPDTKGCILVGSEFRDLNNDGILDLSYSRPILAILFKRLPNKFKLRITH